MREELGRLTQEMTTRTAELAQTEQRVREAREAETSAQRSLATSNREVVQITERRSQLEDMIRTLGSDQDRLRSEVQQAERGQTGARAQLAKLTEDLATHTRELAGMERARTELAERLSATRAELSAMEQALALRTKEVAEVGRQLWDTREQEAKSREELGRLADERDRVGNEVQRAERGQKEAHAQLAKLAEDMAARMRELALVQEEVQTARTELADTQAKLAQTRQQLSAPSPSQPLEPRQ